MIQEKMKLAVLFGIRGVGKSYLVDSLVRSYPNLFYRVKQVTTRARRPNESIDEYNWLTMKQYELFRDRLFAKTKVANNYYGTQIESIDYKHPEKIGFVIVDNNGLKDFSELDLNRFFIVKIGIRTFNQWTRERNTDPEKLEGNMKAYNDVDVLIEGKEDEFISPAKLIISVNEYCESRYGEKFVILKE